jgi:aryl sulfotransferase
MPSLVRPARCECRSWAIDSRRWERYRPRADDIIIATYPKCGTTWTERIVGMLVSQSREPRPIRSYSIWLDCRFRETLDEALARLEAQPGRRILKSHLPLDAIPLYEEVRYIHVARDGRDAWASYYNHRRAYTPEALARFDRIGMEDPAINAPHPRADADPRSDFRNWLANVGRGAQDASVPEVDFFQCERSFWDERNRCNVLLAHYSDMKLDLEREMRRIAAFLGVTCADELWPQLVEAASFESMRRDGAKLMPQLSGFFKEGAETFFFQGRNGRWRDILTTHDLAAYDDKVASSLTSECACWVEGGRVFAGDPQTHRENGQE